MIKDKKYYGEVWFVGGDENKCFSILYIENNNLFLETNLHSKKPVLKELQILGIFTGIGFLTFIDCKIRKSESGITEMRRYSPKYSFLCAHHHIKAVGLKFKKFEVNNKAISDWIDHAVWYNRVDDKLEKKDDLSHKISIKEIGLNITINNSLSYSSKRTELSIKNNGYVTFELDNEVSVLEAFNIYNNFQKLLQLLTSKSNQFSNFGFQCLTCGEWANIYYNDYKYAKSTHTFIHTQYHEVEKDVPIILEAIYTDGSFSFCIDKLMDSILNKQTSHNKRFTNSISTFEAFGKLYSTVRTNNLKKYLKYFAENFMLIAKIDEDAFNKLSSKIIRSRDYHIHSNLSNKNVLSEFELLYISFLIDFVVAYGLLSSFKISEKLKEKIIIHGQSVFINMQQANQILSSNPLNDEL